MTKQTTTETLSARKIAEKLEAARRSPNPAAALLAVADAVATDPAQKRRADAIRFAAKRLEADPFDADAAQAVAVQTDEFHAAARRAAIQARAEVKDPLTVPHNLTFPLAPGRTPDEPMERDTTKLTGRNPFYGR
ncbi:hypothetical protein LGM75_28845 [Burkholderia multivorans]|uniref:hypothetical protein n=1 Tax=Burkholderia multivorans TaxID=87883 RepID=UPI001C22E30D|nr:hypothetical protein [Burkholderia multivorans]MBU9469271.1 hypothetical protein [Burkholderia multivorans]MCA8130353.1 hypothetical protein [Burkholderia multivorans]HEJ2441810.1 hypothetical protein [Burkholderia multivorans]